MGITPGPSELTADELQHVLKPHVDDLIRLYEEGIEVPTPKYPQGNLDSLTSDL